MMVRRGCLVLGMVLVLCGMWSVGAMAQQEGPADVSSPGMGEMSIRDVVENGGWLMYVLAGISVLGLAFVIYCLVVLRSRVVAPTRLRDVLLTHIASGDLTSAREACAQRPCPLSSVCLAALDYVDSVSQVEAALLKDVMEAAGSRHGAALQEPTQYLLDVAAVAPMVGLLGTVLGMLGAFSSVASDMAMARPIVLAGHVSKALVTTAGGLMIGIPAMAFYAYFRGRAARLVGQLESASSEIMTALLRARAG